MMDFSANTANIQSGRSEMISPSFLSERPECCKKPEDSTYLLWERLYNLLGNFEVKKLTVTNIVKDMGEMKELTEPEKRELKGKVQEVRDDRIRRISEFDRGLERFLLAFIIIVLVSLLMWLMVGCFSRCEQCGKFWAYENTGNTKDEDGDHWNEWNEYRCKYCGYTVWKCTSISNGNGP